MEFNTLLYERYGTDGRIGRITLNRPEKLNALNNELLLELEEALKMGAADDRVRVIVIRGSGRGLNRALPTRPIRLKSWRIK